MRIIFLGTPSFSVPVLQALINSKHEVIAVVCQPDKAIGRGHKTAFSPVKQYCVDNNIKVLQYEKISRDGVEELTDLAPDIMITAAYGQILSQKVLEIAKHGVINVHASLLPKYRGSAPIQWSIIKGEKQTGITIMQTALGVDTGDIILQKTVDIADDETCDELFNKLSLAAPQTLLDALARIESNTATFIKQDESKATHFKMIEKADGLINFNNSAIDIVNLVRGLNPWPCAFLNYNGEVIKVHKSQALDIRGQVGEVLFADSKNGLIIATSNGAIRMLLIQKSGGKAMPDTQFLNGFSIKVGSKIE